MLTGSCNCKAVTWEARGEIGQPAACHCTQCRKQSGHVWASAYCAESDLSISGEVRWFSLSDTAKRGFCPTCGAFLFWKDHSEDWISFSMGSVDGSTDLRLRQHIYTAHKGTYYDIADDAPQRED